EQGSLRERARRVDRHDPDGEPAFADERDERRDQARFPDTGRAGDADRVGATGVRVEVVDDLLRERVAVLAQRDGACRRAPVAGASRFDERLARPPPPHRQLAAVATRSGAARLPSLRVIPLATMAATPESAAASAYVQRAPTAAVIGPASAIPNPSSAKLTLMIVVNARPRRWSGAPRWTISELQTMAT